MAKKLKDNYIYAYYQAIKTGKVTVGKWIGLLYDWIIKSLEEKTLIFDQAKANNAIEWIEDHAFHTKGCLAPGPLKLALWQKAIVSCIFGLMNPENGKRQFREVLLVVARKNGKSLFGAAIAKYIWYVDGGYGTDVFCIAPKLAQAELIYGDIWQMTQLDPEWKKLKEEIDNSKDIHNTKTMDDSMLAKKRRDGLRIEGTNSTVRKIAFSAKKSDGFSPSATMADEIASWPGDQGLKQYEVMKSGMGAREMGQNPGLLISFTTSGYVNDSIYDELVKRSTRFLLGDSKETRLLPFLYMIDDIDRWNDINEVAKANPNLGISVSVDYLLEEATIAEGSLSKKGEFITKYCCLKQNSSLAWLSNQTVNKCCGQTLSLEDFRGSYCVGGIDLSRTTDLTSCCVIIEKDKQLYVFSKFFLPSERIQDAVAKDGVPYEIYINRGFLTPSGGNFVDYEDCYQWFVDLVEKYEILPLQVGYDRYNALQLTQKMQAYGFHMDDVFQGENLTPVINEFEGLARDGKIHIGDNDLLKIHFLDSAVKVNAETSRKKLIKLAKYSHIDGMAAVLDAMTVRQKWYGEIGQQLANEV